MTHRLAGLLPGDLTEAQTAVYGAITGGPRASGAQAFALTDEAGRLRGPFNAMLLSPPVGMALQTVGATVRYQSVLSDRVRELAILAVAAHWNSDFEREAHEAVGRACGLTELEMAAVRAGAEPRLDDPRERIALTAAFTLARSGTLDEAGYTEAVAMLTDRGLFELTTLVGYYATLALQLRVFAGERAAD